MPSMETPNPMGSSSPNAISTKTFHIAGILVTVYGLEELPQPCSKVSTLWLLHPRLQTKDIMSPIASQCIVDWNQRRQSTAAHDRGLIAVAFDQRNHGSREVHALGNEAWKKGNTRHAQDMFSIFQGTAMDTSLLMDHLGSYIFPEPNSPALDQNLVLGVSLGGHSAWQALFHEPRVTAAVVIIGCPDYQRAYFRSSLYSSLFRGPFWAVQTIASE
jgi:pimeloyl-ACP methyl ester carboxylesterase